MSRAKRINELWSKIQSMNDVERGRILASFFGRMEDRMDDADIDRMLIRVGEVEAG